MWRYTDNTPSHVGCILWPVRRVYSALCEGTLSVYLHTVAVYYDLWGVCTVHCVRVYCINTVYPHTVRSTHTSQVTICSHNTDTVWGYTVLTQYTLTQCAVHTPHRSQYAAITLTMSCMNSTYPLLTKCVILAKYGCGSLMMVSL